MGLAHVVKASDEDLLWLYPHRTVEDSARAWLSAASASWWSRAAPWDRGHSAAARGTTA